MKLEEEIEIIYDEIRFTEGKIADLEGDLYDLLFECHCCQGYSYCGECHIKKEIKAIEDEIKELENILYNLTRNTDYNKL